MIYPAVLIPALVLAWWLDRRLAARTLEDYRAVVTHVFVAGIVIPVIVSPVLHIAEAMPGALRPTLVLSCGQLALGYLGFASALLVRIAARTAPAFKLR